MIIAHGTKKEHGGIDDRVNSSFGINVIQVDSLSDNFLIHRYDHNPRIVTSL